MSRLPMYSWQSCEGWNRDDDLCWTCRESNIVMGKQVGESQHKTRRTNRNYVKLILPALSLFGEHPEDTSITMVDSVCNG